MYIRKIINIRGSAYMNLPKQVMRNQLLQFGQDVVVRALKGGGMIVMPVNLWYKQGFDKLDIQVIPKK